MGIINPGLELPYVEHEGHANIRTAEGWQAWWLDHDPDGNEAGQPEYKPITTGVDPYRVIEGDASQCWFLRWRRMSAGILQRVHVGAGAVVTFSVPFHVWCSQSDDPAADDGELYVRVGIDPRGGDDPAADDIVWTNWVRGARSWAELGLCELANADKVTLYIQAWNKWALSHNDVYVDDITFTVDGAIEPEPPSPGGDEWIVDLHITGTVRRG